MPTTARCPACQNEVPPRMPTCGWCGASLTAEGEPNTVNVQTVERKVFGVPPATGLLVVGTVVATLAVVLLVRGNLLLGVPVLVGGLLLLGGFPTIARRPGEGAVARRTIRSYDSLRERASAALDSLAARAEARGRLSRLEQDLAQLGQSRAECVRRLGEAAYAENQPEVERLRGEVATAEAAIESKRAQRDDVHRETAERIGAARLRAQPTERLHRDDIAATELDES